jgi:hypothetical protein
VIVVGPMPVRTPPPELPPVAPQTFREWWDERRS